MPLLRKQPRPDPGSLLAWQIFAPIVVCFFVLLLLSGFAARSYFEPVAIERDMARAQRYAEFAAVVFAERLHKSNSRTLSEEFWAAGLDTLEFIPPERIPVWSSPRYVASGRFVDAWAGVRSEDGEVLGAVSIRRQADSLVFVTRTIQSFAVAACLVFALLAVLAWILFRRNVSDRLSAIARQVAPSGAEPGAGTDAIENVRLAAAQTLARTGERDKAMRRLLGGHAELACISAKDGTILEANDAYCSFFGTTREQLVGSNYLDLVPPSDRAEALASVHKLSRARPENTAEHRVLLPDGTTRWMRWRDTAVFDAEGNIKEVLSFGLDISPEKKLGQEINALNIAFAQMQSLAETGSITWDFAQDGMNWTEETRRLLGAGRDAPASLVALIENIATEERESIRRLFQNAREEGKEFECEFRVILPDGSPRVLQSRAEVLADPKTKLLNRLTCTLHDITALRDAEAATKRELRLREAIEQSLASGIIVSDMNGKNILVNPAFCAMTGWTAEELVGRSAPYPYWPEEEMPTINAAFEQALRGETPEEGYELKFCRKDGSRFDVLIKVAPLLDNEDKQLGWLGAVSDISSIQRTRRELAQTGQQLRHELAYREAVDKSTTVGLVAIGNDGSPLSMNDSYARMLGFSPEEILAWTPPYPCWPQEERENIRRAFALHLEGKTPPGGFQVRLQKKDGQRIDVLITASAIIGQDGKQIGLLSALTDISLLQQARRDLQSSNERMRIAQDVMGLGIWEWNPTTDTLFWDRNSFAMFGHPDADDAKVVWAAAHSEEERERLTYELKRLIEAGGENGQDRLRIRWPDGSEHNILSTYVIFRDESGKANRVIGVNRDVTTELEQERELRVAQERLSAALEGGKFGTFEHVFGLGAINWNSVNYEIHGIDPAITDPDELFRAWLVAVGNGYPAIEQTIASLPVDQTSVTYDFDIRLPSTGEKRRVRSSVFVERNKNGHPVRLVGVSRRLD